MRTQSLDQPLAQHNRVKLTLIWKKEIETYIHATHTPVDTRLIYEKVRVEVKMADLEENTTKTR